jgi:hypothetical protein
MRTVFLGQRVNVKAFTDCFGKHHPPILGLTVESIERVSPGTMRTWFSVKAVGNTPACWYFKANKSFFEEAT